MAMPMKVSTGVTILPPVSEPSPPSYLPRTGVRHDGGASARGKEAVGDARYQLRDPIAANRKNFVPFLEGILDIARLSGEAAQSMDVAAGGFGKLEPEFVRLLLGHRDDEIRALQQFRMALQVGGSGLGADVDTDIAEHQARVERHQCSVTCVGGDTRRAHRDEAVDAAALEFAPQQMLSHDTARGI